MKKVKIKTFRGCFMRDALPNGKPWKKECMVINQDSIKSNGTHWCCYAKDNDNNAFYFDSFGKLGPPLELIKYLGSDCKIYYNSKNCQDFNTFICGHLCLTFLYGFYKGNK